VSRGRFPEFGTCPCKTKCPPGHYSAREGVGIVGAPSVVPRVGRGLCSPPFPYVQWLRVAVEGEMLYYGKPPVNMQSLHKVTPPTRAATPHFQRPTGRHYRGG